MALLFAFVLLIGLDDAMKCSYLPDINYDGIPLKVINATTADVCCGNCTEMLLCKFWVWTPAPVPADSGCELKALKTFNRKMPGTISGDTARTSSPTRSPTQVQAPTTGRPTTLQPAQPTSPSAQPNTNAPSSPIPTRAPIRPQTVSPTRPTEVLPTKAPQSSSPSRAPTTNRPSQSSAPTHLPTITPFPTSSPTAATPTLPSPWIVVGIIIGAIVGIGCLYEAVSYICRCGRRSREREQELRAPLA